MSILLWYSDQCCLTLIMEYNTNNEYISGILIGPQINYTKLIKFEFGRHLQNAICRPHIISHDDLSYLKTETRSFETLASIRLPPIYYAKQQRNNNIWLELFFIFLYDFSIILNIFRTLRWGIAKETWGFYNELRDKRRKTTQFFFTIAYKFCSEIFSDLHLF